MDITMTMTNPPTVSAACCSMYIDATMSTCPHCQTVQAPVLVPLNPIVLSDDHDVEGDGDVSGGDEDMAWVLLERGGTARKPVTVISNGN